MQSAGKLPASSPSSRPLSLPELLIRTYDLNDFSASFAQRQKAILANGGDVIFTTPHDSQILTHAALFSVAATQRGRQAVAPERYGKSQDDVGGILKAGEGEEAVNLLKNSAGGKDGQEQPKIVQCFDEQFAHVKRIYGHMTTKTAEQLDRLLDEVLKSEKEGYAAGAATPEFVVELEAEEEGVKEKGRLMVATKAPKRESLKKDRATPSTPRKTANTPAGTSKPVVSGSRRFSTPRKPSISGSTKEPVRSPGRDGRQVSAFTNDGSTSSTMAPVSSSSAKVAEDTSYADIKLHRFVVTASIPYYRYLSLSHMHFSDSSSNTSTLPYPTITYYALRVVQRWLYNPLRIGEMIEEYEPNAHLYLLSNCKRQDKNGYPPPAATAKGLVEVARAADYLDIAELSAWAAKMLRKMCHRLDKCTGNNCKVMVPYILQQIDESDGLGIPQDLIDDIISFVAINPETMWKRPLILLSDDLLENILEALEKKLSKQSAVPMKKKKGDNDETPAVSSRPLICWQTYVELSRVRSSIQASRTGNWQRWEEKLLGPAIEFCVHQIAKGFDDPRLAAELQSKMESGSFERNLVVELLMQITLASTVPDIGRQNNTGDMPSFEKPVLNRKTVRPIFEGIVNLRTWDGYDTEWGTAEKRVVDFLKREWVTIVVNGEGSGGQSGFKNWRPAMLKSVSRKLRVSIDDLLGKEKKGNVIALQGLPLKGKGKMVKDRLGNDIIAGDSQSIMETTPGESSTFNSTRSASPVPRQSTEAFRGSSGTLRPEAEPFTPSGVS